MTQTTKLTRRQAIASAAALPLAGGALAAGTGRARAAAEMMGPGGAPYHRFVLGGFEVTTLLAATAPRENPHGIFGTNVSDEEFAEVSEAAFLPTDVAQFFFTPTVVNTGAELILFDTGLNPGGITDALAAAGYGPEQVDKVVITHMHPDHIGGLMTDGGPTFANATHHAGAVEANFWAENPNDPYTASVAPLVDQFAYFDYGDSLASGITALDAHGHTPGHTAFMIESDGAGLVLIADAANHPVWSLERPDWEVLFDADKAAAAETRRRLLGMIAADRLPLVGYHMPFPATGFVETRGDGFRWIPESYQLRLPG